MKQLLDAWFNLVCTMVPRVSRGVLLSDIDNVNWPATSTTPKELQSAAELARSQSAPVFSGTGDSEGELLVAYPLTINDAAFGSIALSITAGMAQQQVVVQLLNWSQAWLELLLQQDHKPDETGLPYLDFLRDILEADDAEVAWLKLSTHLAEHFDCEHVCLGLRVGDDITILGISNNARFDTRVNLLGMIGDVMEEAAQNEAIIIQGSNRENPVAHFAHELLARELGDHELCTAPLIANSHVVGALSFDRQAGKVFNASDVAGIEQLTSILGPVIANRHKVEQSIFNQIHERAAANLKKLTGESSLVARSIAIALLVVAGILIFVKGNYEVTAEASLESVTQRAIVAPFDGFVSESNARAGDDMNEGQVIAKMDDTDLQLELLRLEGEREALNREYRQALAALNHADTRIFKARIDQTDARLQLLQHRLDQVELRAPFAGVIISGDLSRALGTPITKGDLLYEIAPLEDYRIVLSVAEADVDDITPGQSGHVILTAHPTRKLPFVVENVSSVIDSDQTTGVQYRTEATLVETSLTLRPGMAGLARVVVGRRTLGWILVHDIADWVRLFAWRWLP